MNNGQEKILNTALKDIEKKFGKQTFSKIDNFNVETIPSGSFALDKATGINGFPRGRIIEIYGNESSGKTTIALQAIKSCLNNFGNVAYIDAENALDANYISGLGIDPDKLLIANPEYGEQAFSIVDALIKTEMIDLIVVDSVAALVPKMEIEGDVNDQMVGSHARMMSKGLRMIQSTIAKSKTCVIFINQVREKVGVLFGNNEITTGGRALKFFSSMRIEVKRSELLKNGTEINGIKSKVTITKNKLAAPFTSCFVDIYFGKGFNETKEILDFAIEYEIIQKNGSWYSYNDEKIGQGRSQVDTYFLENPDKFLEVKNLILQKI